MDAVLAAGSTPCHESDPCLRSRPYCGFTQQSSPASLVSLKDAAHWQCLNRGNLTLQQLLLQNYPSLEPAGTISEFFAPKCSVQYGFTGQCDRRNITDREKAPDGCSRSNKDCQNAEDVESMSFTTLEANVKCHFQLSHPLQNPHTSLVIKMSAQCSSTSDLVETH